MMLRTISIACSLVLLTGCATVQKTAQTLDQINTVKGYDRADWNNRIEWYIGHRNRSH
jgi:uncharacterized protein YceK